MGNEGALKGVQVLDISRMLPGPYCSMVLADHGASVIAIQNKGSKDGLFFKDLTRNKHHMSLDLKSSRGRKVFFELAAEADVIIEGFRPGVVAKLGVDYDAVREINPEIIYCSITGYGQTGPLSQTPGHDINYISEAGLLDMVGQTDKTPSIPGFQIGDIAGGGMNAVSGILLALFHRQRTGKGQHIDISMTDGLVGMLLLPLYFSRLQGRLPVRSDELLSHRYACYNCYETKDKKYVSIGALEKKFWVRLCGLLDLSHLEDLQYDKEQRENIKGTFKKKFLEHTQEEWGRLFAGEDVCYSPVNTIQDVLESKHFLARDLVIFNREKSTDGQSFGIPIKLSKSPGQLNSGPCDFGSDTTAILTELNYSEAEIQTLYTDGVV